MNSPATCARARCSRIANVRALRAAQFPEDAGPLAHNVRPETYHEINNFYTATIYEKGAEVIRMLKVLIGDEAFARGMDLYFERYDGTAATVEDFVACFAEASGRDLAAFSRWYHQAGTPLVQVVAAYDAAARTFSLELAQSCGPTPGQASRSRSSFRWRWGSWAATAMCRSKLRRWTAPARRSSSAAFSS